MTYRYAENITKQVIHSNINNVAKNHKLMPEEVESMVMSVAFDIIPFGEIVGYFDQKTTSAVVEGINNKLKLLKRCGFGFRNFKNFEIRATEKLKEIQVLTIPHSVSIGKNVKQNTVRNK